METPSFKTVMMAKSIVKATCLVHTVYDATVTWLMDDKPASSNQVTQATYSTHIISNLIVSFSDWKKLKFLKCKAEHRCFTSNEHIVKVSGKGTTQNINQVCFKSKGSEKTFALFPVIILQGLQLHLHQWRSGDLSQIYWAETELCLNVTSHNCPPLTSM